MRVLRCLWSNYKIVYVNTCMSVNTARMNSVSTFSENVVMNSIFSE